MPRARVIAAASLLVVAPQLAAQDRGDEREAPEVRKVVFRGVKTVSTDELRQSIKTDETRCRGLLLQPFCLISDWKAVENRRFLDRTELRRDILRIRIFYWKRGFRETKVDTVVAKKGDGVLVEFRVTEGAPTVVSSVRVFRPPNTLSDRDIQSEMRVRAGQPLNVIALDSSVSLLSYRLWDRGWGDAEVRTDSIVVDSAARAARVYITADPKWRTTVGSITIRGNERVSEKTIRNSLTLEPGDLYRRSRVSESQRNLYESGLFQRAVIIVPPQGDSVKALEITVQEALLREIRTSAGFNTAEFVQAEARYTQYNWFGGARRLNVRATLGNLLASQLNNRFPFEDVLAGTGETITDDERSAYFRPTWIASAEVSQPWLWSPRNSGAIGVFAHRRTAPAVFIDRGMGASASFTRMLASRAPTSLSYRVELTRVLASDVFFCQNYGVCEVETIAALRRAQRLSPIGVNTGTDRSNDPLNPTRGYRLQLDAEHASAFTISDFRYNRLTGEAAKYARFGARQVIVAHLRGGVVRALGSTSAAVLGTDAARQVSATANILHPRKRFYAGGSQSVRGYGENQLGPRVLTLDPGKLTSPQIVDGRTVPPICTNDQLAVGDCDPNSILSKEFIPRPTGGNSLIEGSIEFRFPVWRKLEGAAFVDAGVVSEGSINTLTRGTGAVTPGFGFRYVTPVGPIRIDLGVKPKLKEDLAVITEYVDANGRRRIVELNTRKAYDPLEGGKGGIRHLLDRLTLHLSIGQAY